MARGFLYLIVMDWYSRYSPEASYRQLETAGARISNEGRERWLDNVFVEQLSRSLKHEELNLKTFVSGLEARISVDCGSLLQRQPTVPG
jgi:hypothetical protein